MSHTEEDTIVAIATPRGRGGIAIIRLSGPQSLKVAQQISGISPKPRFAHFRQFKDGNEVIDEGIVLYFPAPHSYTGEDILELQGHAGNIVPYRVMEAVLKIPGVRQAEPGEFTKRAFLNGRMDLTSAEAVEDLISAGSNSAAKAAMASLDGAFSKDMEKITDQITMFRVRIEGCLDFPEEHEDFFDSGRANSEIQVIINLSDLAIKRATQGIKLNDGARIVLSGAPNAGKSSLLNALSGSESAIVTNIPGTTRDILSINIELDGVPLMITDTAGIRDTPSDEIEAIGIRKALEALKLADLVIFMLDGSALLPNENEILSRLDELKKQSTPVLIAVSKSDLPLHSSVESFLSSDRLSSFTKVRISVKKTDGLKELKKAVSLGLGIMPVEGVYSARARPLSELKNAHLALIRAKEMLTFGDLVLGAQEMRCAQDHIGAITGKITSDDILGKIFSTFCIGK